MKLKHIILLTFCLISGFLYSQEKDSLKSSGKIGLGFSSFGVGDVLRNKDYIGGPGITGKGFFTIGLDYLKPLNKTIEIEAGFEYSRYKFEIEPGVDPNQTTLPYTTHYSLMTIPVALRVNFLDYCFINGGVLLDFDTGVSNPINSQTGLGANLGFGVQYNFEIGLSAFVNPYLRMHSLVGFSSDSENQRLLESGIRLGILYTLKH